MVSIGAVLCEVLCVSACFFKSNDAAHFMAVVRVEGSGIGFRVEGLGFRVRV